MAIKNPVTQARRRSPELKQKVDYELLNGLYRKTIVNKIITKFTQTAIPQFFTLNIENEEGERILELEELARPLNEKITRKFFREILKEMLLNGTAFIYIGGIKRDIEEDIFLLDPKDLNQEEDENGTIIGWTYSQGYSDRVLIPFDDIITIANDADINEIYGYSILEPMLEFLHYFLNANYDIAMLIDKFCIPILLWLVDTEDTDLSDGMINKIRETLLQQFDAGDDIVLDDKIKAEVLGFGKDSINLPELLRELRANLGMISIPESLLGGEAPNLNAIKIQLQMFYGDCSDYQTQLNDLIVDKIYKPYLSSQGYNIGKEYSNCYINFPLPTLENNSDSIMWIREGIKLGIISRAEGRLTLGFRGKPVTLDDLKETLSVLDARNDKPSDLPKIRDGRDSGPDNEPITDDDV